MGFDDFGLKLSDFGLNFWHFGLKIGKNVKISGLYIKFLKSSSWRQTNLGG